MGKVEEKWASCVELQAVKGTIAPVTHNHARKLNLWEIRIWTKMQ